MINSSLSEEEKPTYKIIILGKSAAGKTKLLVRYLYETYQDAGNVTVMVDCSFKTRNNCKYAYYDTAGQEAYRSILNLYFKGTDAVILVYSTDDTSTFDELEFYYKKVKEELPDCLIYIVGCKADLDCVVSPQLVEQTYEVKRHFITSAKKNIGVDRAFEQIELDLEQRNKPPSSILLSPGSFSFDVGARKNKKKRGNKCC